MKQSVTLKGTKDGFVLTLDESVAFETVLSDLDQLLEKLHSENKEQKEVQKGISLEVKTGMRLFSEDEKAEITEKISSKSQFQLKKISAEVLTYQQATEWHESNSLQMEIQTIRSGQVLQAPGDILLIGKIHPGGTIRASGSIFILGELLGLAHAGFDGDNEAIVVADFQTDAQIRIAESVQIIENKAKNQAGTDEKQFAYINDLHILDFEGLDKLRTIRPKMGKVTGGLF
ncbi:septum site-determining protein MinC [Carnobacterium maltaromaticum]|uniref:Probable septum site-determining protein MinC n=1 Tax=Carnobacterium maltaromaticum LMA28 TaxID=1234679 RepID=K8E3A7_CARML|nr:septum site-determining protein MinC [Carnobacterium maltaromaticum]AOA01703.1 septum site-determining protein MinC [Carnobacterium maltaromaticum]MBC9810704.1 septum site-determining protein MinC [Carnobacterium maltaromaticum]MCI1820030.1 septum site-determining protein MinC [Carnobacterium maltaromaticum]CCO10737.2 septum formation inhibitor MinC, C-terminal domain protein [Carnobacterium maltaromaticum LMA28]CRH18429.1 Septum formation inhibitor MinC, C-terminal domain protein [Carnobac